MSRHRSVILGPEDPNDKPPKDLVAIGLLSKPRKRQAAKAKRRRIAKDATDVSKD
jgi:hypothetical protein